jgi:hypothetical protein
MSWKNTGAPYPWREFDPDAKLAFTFDFSDFVALAGEGLTLASADVVDLDPALEQWGAPASTAGAVLTMRLQRSALETTKQDLRFTLRPTLSDGQRTDRTFILRLTDQ